MAAGDITTNLRTYLLTISAVTDLLGTTTEIFPDALPQRGGYTLPAVVLHEISGSDLRHLSGSADKGETTIQIDCWADNRDDGNALSEAVRKNIEHYAGAAGDDTIDHAYCINRRTFYEPPVDASEDGLYNHSRDYRIVHNLPAVST